MSGGHWKRLFLPPETQAGAEARIRFMRAIYALRARYDVGQTSCEHPSSISAPSSRHASDYAACRLT